MRITNWWYLDVLYMKNMIKSRCLIILFGDSDECGEFYIDFKYGSKRFHATLAVFEFPIQPIVIKQVFLILCCYAQIIPGTTRGVKHKTEELSVDNYVKN